MIVAIEFMHIEWSEEKFLKDSVVQKIRLRLYKYQHTDLLPTQLASYRHMIAREFKYQLQD